MTLQEYVEKRRANLQSFEELGRHFDGLQMSEEKWFSYEKHIALLIAYLNEHGGPSPDGPKGPPLILPPDKD